MAYKQNVAPAGGHQPDKRRAWWKPVALLAALLALALVFHWLGFGGRIPNLKVWVKSYGPWGPFVFILLYIVATVAALPASALTIAAGALFGSFWGIVYVTIAATPGAAICFLIARHFGRSAFARWLYGKKRLERLDRLIEAHGAMVVSITRLVPIFPTNVLNYAFGLTRVPFSTFVIFTLICMVPGNLLFVVATDAVVTALQTGEVPWTLVCVVVLVAEALTLLIRAARRKFAREEAEHR